MSAKGLTLPDVAFRPYSAAELAALDDLQPGVLVILLYGGAIDLIHMDQIEPYLAAHRPRLLFRPYAGNIPQWQPADWARECAHRCEGYGRPYELICDNERNLAVEHGDETWDKHIDWLTSFAAEWRKRSTAPLHLGALSPSGNWVSGLLAYEAAGLHKLFERKDAHGYGQDAPSQVEQVEAILGGPIDVTEFNQIDPGEMTDLGPAVESVTWFILGGTPDQAVYDLLKQPEKYQSFKRIAKEVPMPEFDSPNHEGPRAATVGVVLHATLGGSPTPQTEYDATVNWFRNPASQASAHAVVGPAGQVHRPVRTEEIAWHAKAANKDHLGIEMAKAHLGDPILPEILDSAARIVAGWCHDYEIPIAWSASHGIEEHRNIPGNNHSDVGGPFDRADFLARVKHYAGQGDDLTNEQKTKLLDHLAILWGETKAATIAANPAESERACHERIVAIKELLGVN